MLDQLKGSQREHMASIVDEMVKSKNLVQDHFQVSFPPVMMKFDLLVTNGINFEGPLGCLRFE